MADMSGPLTTGVDALVDLVNSRGTVSFQEAADTLKVSLSTIESWAQFLEEEGLLKVTYSFTKPFLVAMGGPNPKGPAPVVRVKAAYAKPRKPSVAGVSDEEPTEVDNLLEQAREALARGDIDQAKKIYDQLEQEYKDFPLKVKKDREALISTLESLHDAYLTSVSGADKASEEIADTVRTNLSLVQQYSSKGQLNDALDAFTKANDAFSKLAPGATELRLSLTPLLSQAQQTLVDAEVAHSSKNWESQMNRLTALLNDLDQAIVNKEMTRAFALYDQLEAAKKAMPPLFEEKKAALESKMLPAYEKLITMHVEIARRELAQKLELLDTLKQKIENAIRGHDHQEASKLYDMAKRVYVSIPNEFFEKKVEAQRVLLSYARRISELELDVASSDIRSKINSIDDMTSRASAKLANGDVAAAHELYTKALQQFSSLSRGFITIKSPVQKKLITLYSALLEVTDKKVSPVKQAPVDAFIDTLHRFQHALAQGQWDDALVAYADLRALDYVPTEHKDECDLAMRQGALLEEARQLSTIPDKEELKKALVSFYKHYQDLHSRVPEQKLFYDYVRKEYVGASNSLDVKKSAPAAPAPRQMPQIRVMPPIRTAEPVQESPQDHIRLHVEDALALWQDAISKGDWHAALSVRDVLDSVQEIPADLAESVETLSAQAELLRESIDLETITDPLQLAVAVRSVYDHYSTLMGESTEPEALYRYVKQCYLSAHERSTTKTVAIKKSRLAEPMRLKPHVAADWVSTLRRWHEAVERQDFKDALAAVDSFTSLEPVEEDRAYEVGMVLEQAALLREAQEIAETRDRTLLRPMLVRFYDHYNEVLTDHPTDKQLYQYLRTTYIAALKIASQR